MIVVIESLLEVADLLPVVAVVAASSAGNGPPLVVDASKHPPGLVNHAGQPIRRLELDALRPGFDSGTENAGWGLAEGAIRPGYGSMVQATLRRRAHSAHGRAPQRRTPVGEVGAIRTTPRVMFSRTKQPSGAGRTTPRLGHLNGERRMGSWRKAQFAQGGSSWETAM